MDAESKSSVEIAPSFESVPNLQGEKLYDRAVQEQQLLEAFYRCIDPNENQRELTLITGVSGTGKTALARTLEAHVVGEKTNDVPVDDRRGYFISGKFDQLQHPDPYAPFVAAFTSFANLILMRGESAIEQVRADIQKSAGGSMSGHTLLVDMVPTLGKILDIPPSKRRVSMKGTKAQKRFFHVVLQFLRAIYSPQHPVVLFIDDLQWADAVSLDLVKALVTGIDTTPGFMLLGACRSNEVSLQDPLSVMLRDIEDRGVHLSEIRVSCLGIETLGVMLSNILHMSVKECAPLAAVVSSQTGGNVFFVTEFLRMLQEESLLLETGRGKWTWDVDQILRAMTEVDVVQLLVRKMGQLPKEVQDVLKAASCIGAKFDEETLQQIGTVVSSQVVPAISIAEDRGFVTFDYDSGEGRWVHDRFQQAAYALIHESNLASFHLLIGRQIRIKIKGRSSSAEFRKHIFLVVNQMIKGVDLLEDQTEKDDLALLCLRAGQQATMSAAFSVAATYLDEGISLLGYRHWRDQYDLSLDLFNTSAEVAYCNGDFERVDELLDEIFSNARSFDDMLWAHSTRIYALGARNETHIAIKEGLLLLAKLGVRIPPQPGSFRTIWELLKMQRRLRGRSDDDILNLPPLTDKRMLAAMQILNLMFVDTFWSRKDLMPIVSMRMLQITMRHGLNGMASAVFGGYAIILSFLNKIDEAYRYAKLALRLLDKYQTKEWTARTHLLVFSAVIPCVEPFRNSLQPLLTGHQAGLVSGDIEMSMLCAQVHSMFSLYCGNTPLRRFVAETKTFQILAESYGQGTVRSFIIPMVQYGLNLLGGAAVDPLVLTGNAMNEEEEMENAVQQKNSRTGTFILVLKHLLAAYMLEYEVAEFLSARIRNMGTRPLLPISLRVHFFHEGVVFAVRARQLRSRRKARCARRILRRLKGYALYSPENLTNKVQLLEAELAMNSGKYDDALVWFRRSIESAGREGFISEQALACERAGLALLIECGKAADASAYLLRARSLYEQWGARIKVNQLDLVISEIASH